MIRSGFSSLAVQQSSKESFRGVLITVRLNQDVDHIAVLIHGAPEILLLAVDSNEDVVQVPNIAEAALTPLQFSGIVRTELLTPESNRFIRDDDSAFGEKILDIPKAQAETMVSPDRIADDFWRETMTVIARPVVHGTQCFSLLPKLTMPVCRQPHRSSAMPSMAGGLKVPNRLAGVVVHGGEGSSALSKEDQSARSRQSSRATAYGQLIIPCFRPSVNIDRSDKHLAALAHAGTPKKPLAQFDGRGLYIRRNRR